MNGMLNIYHLRQDSLQIDCAMNSFRRQNYYEDMLYATAVMLLKYNQKTIKHCHNLH